MIIAAIIQNHIYTHSACGKYAAECDTVVDLNGKLA